MDAPVMILNWNGWEDTFACLRSLRESADVNLVWLVDNGSTLDRGDEARALYPGLRVLRWDQNYGYAGGYNRALKIAANEGYEFAYLLNNDCLVTSGFLESIVKAAKENISFAVVGSRIIYANNPEYLEFDGEHFGIGEKRFYEDKSTKIVRQVIGAGMLVRLKALDSVGFFDEEYFCYWEEIEWCARVRKKGYQCAVSAESVIYHKHHSSDVGANRQYYLIRNLFLLLDFPQDEDRQRVRAQIIYESTVNAEAARRKGNWRDWFAIACALYDGITGKFGKRQHHKIRLTPCVYLIFFSLKTHLSDKLQALKGLPPKSQGENSIDKLIAHFLESASFLS